MTPTLENAMVVGNAGPDYILEPLRTEACAICDKTGCLLEDGWYTDTFVEHDERDYLAGGGEYLSNAVDTPAGWVCSNRCRSQAMYNVADEREKASLDAVRDACLVIAEQGQRALSLVEAFMGEHVNEALVQHATRFLEFIADGADSMPDWCNRPTREETLEREAVRCAVHPGRSHAA